MFENYMFPPVIIVMEWLNQLLGWGYLIISTNVIFTIKTFHFQFEFSDWTAVNRKSLYGADMRFIFLLFLLLFFTKERAWIFTTWCKFPFVQFLFKKEVLYEGTQDIGGKDQRLELIICLNIVVRVLLSDWFSSK